MADSGSGTVHVGASCALPSCNLNDFLPIRCKCDQLFCRDHIQPDLHTCPLLAQVAQPGASGSTFKLQRCAASKCNKPSLEAYISNAADTADRAAALCPGCRQAFCAEHREPNAHSCTPPEPTEPVPEKNAAAKALLSKHFGPSSTATASGTSRSATSANPKKLAQQRQIAVMKMRHKAKPADPKDTAASVPVGERLHVKVRKAEEDIAAERILWFKKSIWTGRAVDILATQLKMTISDSQPVKVLYVNDEGTSVTLRTDQPLADQIHDGASVCLSR